MNAFLKENQRMKKNTVNIKEERKEKPPEEKETNLPDLSSIKMLGEQSIPLIFCGLYVPVTTFRLLFPILSVRKELHIRYTYPETIQNKVS